MMKCEACGGRIECGERTYVVGATRIHARCLRPGAFGARQYRYRVYATYFREEVYAPRRWWVPPWFRKSKGDRDGTTERPVG